MARLMKIPVDRTCPFCNVDRGILQQGRFYDWHAKNGTLENKYPIVHGGLLNLILFCGEEKCLKKAMAHRKETLDRESKT